jgi:hypothetical protein
MEYRIDFAQMFVHVGAIRAAKCVFTGPVVRIASKVNNAPHYNVFNVQGWGFA